MTRKQLIEKVRKCLALAQSANEHEAAAALAKARALMDDHGLSDDDLRLAGIEEATARATRNQRPPIWEQYLSETVKRAFGVIGFINANGDRTFVGRGANPEIASYAFAVLFRSLKRSRTNYIKTKLRRCGIARKRRDADIYCQAWAHAVYDKVKALAPESPHDPTFGQYLEEHHPGLVTVKSRTTSIRGRGATAAYWDGHKAGRNAEISHGVSGGHSPLSIE